MRANTRVIGRLAGLAALVIVVGLGVGPVGPAGGAPAGQTLPAFIEIQFEPDPPPAGTTVRLTVTVTPPPGGVPAPSQLLVSASQRGTGESVSRSVGRQGGGAGGAHVFTGLFVFPNAGTWDVSVPFYPASVPGSRITVTVPGQGVTVAPTPTLADPGQASASPTPAEPAAVASPSPADPAAASPTPGEPAAAASPTPSDAGAATSPAAVETPAATPADGSPPAAGTPPALGVGTPVTTPLVTIIAVGTSAAAPAAATPAASPAVTTTADPRFSVQLDRPGAEAIYFPGEVVEVSYRAEGAASVKITNAAIDGRVIGTFESSGTVQGRYRLIAGPPGAYRLTLEAFAADGSSLGTANALYVVQPR